MQNIMTGSNDSQARERGRELVVTVGILMESFCSLVFPATMVAMELLYADRDPPFALFMIIHNASSSINVRSFAALWFSVPRCSPFYRQPMDISSRDSLPKTGCNRISRRV